VREEQRDREDKRLEDGRKDRTVDSEKKHIHTHHINSETERDSFRSASRRERDGGRK